MINTIMEKQEIFTLHLSETTDELNDLFDARLNTEYESIEAAQESATELARELNKSYPDKCFCISVMAGEYKDTKGNIHGEPQDIWTISSLDKEQTIAARMLAYYAKHEVDAYAVCVKHWDVIKQTFNPTTHETAFEVDGAYETRDDAMVYVNEQLIEWHKDKSHDIHCTTVKDWYAMIELRNGWKYCWIAVHTVSQPEMWHQYMNESVFK